MAAKLVFKNVVLCDYVAEGARNKPILIGVFSGDVLVGSLPAMLNFGLYLEYLPPGGGTIDMGIHFVLGGREVAKAMVRAENVKVGEPVTFLIPMFSFNVVSPTLFEIFASRSGFKKTEIISKTISVGTGPSPSSTAPQPPS